MIFKENKIKGIYEILLEPRQDERGFFMRTYEDEKFKEYGLDREWVHENHSLSAKRGTARGIHFQYPPDTETKLLRAITGEIYFAVVDLRKGSSSFGKWTSMVVSAEKKNMLYVPMGCAPGMYTLTDNCNLVYKVDNYYAPNNEDVIGLYDPDIGIEWPEKEPAVISERDKNGKSFKEFIAECGGIEV